jgi:hypothetical protein
VEKIFQLEIKKHEKTVEYIRQVSSGWFCHIQVPENF